MVRGVLSDLMARVSDVGRSLAAIDRAPPELKPEAVAGLASDLMSGTGEATGLALAREVLERYGSLDGHEKRSVFGLLRERFGVDQKALGEAVARWQDRPDDDAARALHYACEPRSQELLRMLNRAPGGTAALVAMRNDLLGCLREAPELAPLDTDFRHLFSSWFNRGFLELRRIDWDTSAAILEKIIRYEAVHAIQDWDDLRRRVAAPDRRLYGFFHPALPGEPLIFVEVALTEAIPEAIGPILAEDRTEIDPARASTAVFYSISNCQTGLRGISFGNFLIKQVVEELRGDVPSVKVFVTLSPVPGLRRWATAESARGGAGALTEAERTAVRRLDPIDGSIDAQTAAEATDRLAGMAAAYLLDAKGRDGRPLDPVARFHLGNGARLERINLAADHSARGLTGAWGVMVNYLYDLDEIERNHESFANTGAVTTATAVRKLARARQEDKR